MSNKLVIKYGDITEGAKDSFIPTMSDMTDFSDPSLLQMDGVKYPNYGNPCELYSVPLDGKSEVIPTDKTGKNFGCWSEQISEADGTFATPVTLILNSTETFSSSGIRLAFDKYNNIYPVDVVVEWYRGEGLNITMITSKSYTPDSADYFFDNVVDAYNEVIFRFNKLNMPYNRLKVTGVDYGYGEYIFDDELDNVNITQEINPVSTDISINTVDFNVRSSDRRYYFRAKQPISAYIGDKLVSTTFIRSSRRMRANMYNISSEDYISIMDDMPFKGGMYSGSDARDVIRDIFNAANVPYEIEPELEAELTTSELIWGYIPYTNCRKALMQVAFAIQAAVDTSNSDKVKIYRLNADVQQTIPLRRIMQGQYVTESGKITGVELLAHSYIVTDETVQIYSAVDNGAGNGIFIQFNEPIYRLSINSGSIIESGVNYAVINAVADTVLTGQRYRHLTTKKGIYNENLTRYDVKKVLTISDATLISDRNIDNVLDKCYNWFVRNNTINMTIVEGSRVVNGVSVDDKAVNVGDTVTTETEYMGNITGTVIRQSYKGTGGLKIFKDVVIK